MTKCIIYRPQFDKAYRQGNTWTDQLDLADVMPVKEASMQVCRLGETGTTCYLREVEEAISDVIEIDESDVEDCIICKEIIGNNEIWYWDTGHWYPNLQQARRMTLNRASDLRHSWDNIPNDVCLTICRIKTIQRRTVNLVQEGDPA